MPGVEVKYLTRAALDKVELVQLVSSASGSKQSIDSFFTFYKTAVGYDERRQHHYREKSAADNSENNGDLETSAIPEKSENGPNPLPPAGAWSRLLPILRTVLVQNQLTFYTLTPLPEGSGFTRPTPLCDCLISLSGGDVIRVLCKGPLIRMFLNTWVRWRPVRGRTYF
ncbi:hypothetical protein T492DRAFT_123265 [Pavlovales sp. CCMP2436]|nr:hypothetical protein T492DRAFT_123265 [Pavlovales sp. CCMP2436]